MTAVSSETIRRLRWKARRGILELDIFLNNIIDHHYADFTEQERMAFDEFLLTPDQVMMDWLLLKREPDQPIFAEFIAYFDKDRTVRDD